MAHLPKTIEGELVPVDSPPVALAVAGFDPSSGAGVTADLKTFAAHGVYGVACITSLTVQSTLGVRAVQPQSAEWVRQTLHCLAEDVTLAGIKIGMLGTGAVAAAVSSFLAGGLAGLPRSRVVLDPLVRSSSGAPLIEPEGVEFIRNRLLRQVGWITPNREELAVLAGDSVGMNGRPLREEVILSARRLRSLAARLGNEELNMVVTGGDCERPDDFLLTSSGEEVWLPGERVETNATHGTGCAFSSALLCGLIAGETPLAATKAAKDYVAAALRCAYPIGHGKGPMHHLFRLSPKS